MRDWLVANIDDDRWLFCAVNIGLFKNVIVTRISNSILVARIVILSPAAYPVQMDKASTSIQGHR